MLRVSDSRNFSRTFTALNLTLGPLLLLISTLLAPVACLTCDLNTNLDILAADRTTSLYASLLFLIGEVILISGLIGVVHLLRGQRVTIGQVGASLLIINAAIGNFYALSVFSSIASNPKYDRNVVIPLLSDMMESPWGGLVLLIMFLVGDVIGSAMLAFGVFLRGTIPRWVPIMLFVWPAVSFFAPNKVLAAVALGLLTFGLAGISWQMLTISDEQWAQWQVLPITAERK